jgi:formylglycine-generating enzyme required for sulfatase activity
MGDLQGEGDIDQIPVHTVQIIKPIALSRFEVTFDEYDAFAKATNRSLPSDQSWGRGRRPVINVSWEDAQAYAKWLSEQTGKRYRLPSEAEWEYVARAGSKTSYWWGDQIGKGQANCRGCGSQWDANQTAMVGSFKPSSFGLYDTAGNVWEWVEDCWHENYNGAPTDGRAWKEENGGQCGQRVIRGGSWGNHPVSLRSSVRSRFVADFRGYFIGFRLAQDIE